MSQLDVSIEAIAPLFAALGDPTRAWIVGRLAREGRLTITDLSRARPAISRQAVTRHISVLSDAGIIVAERRGRETRLAVNPVALAPVRHWLDEISAAWDDALERLAAHLENVP
ncbi:ArsR/SmtB family transcription factor [Bradyrhizobium elkanii]|uniref:ArsR/SmtB family transcription factor n=1 Tax=Bradyrhizobium elkanii TaxID=29448 RepID=UPI003519B073